MRGDDDKEPRRKKGETESESCQMARILRWQNNVRKLFRLWAAIQRPPSSALAMPAGKPAARGRYADLRAKPPKAAAARTPADPYAGAGLHLADTLEWLQLWQDNANAGDWPDDNFSAKQQDQYFPQP